MQAAIDSIQVEINSVITGEIAFKKNQDILLQQGLDIVDAVAAVLRKYPAVHVLIDGHAHGARQTAYFLDLSERRAQAVKAELIRQGVDADHMVARGSGAVGRGTHVFISVTEADDAGDTELLADSDAIMNVSVPDSRSTTGDGEAVDIIAVPRPHYHIVFGGVPWVRRRPLDDTSRGESNAATQTGRRVAQPQSEDEYVLRTTLVFFQALKMNE